MMRRTHLVPVVIMSLCLTGCGSSLQMTNTPEPTPFPPPQPVTLVDFNKISVESVCLEINQTFTNAQGREPLPLTEPVTEILEAAGMQVAEQDCAAQLTYNLVFEALSASYLGAGTCYTGVDISGEMMLTAGDETRTEALHARREPSDTTSSCVEDPANTYAHIYPFWNRLMLESLQDAWGDRILLYGFVTEFGSDAADVLEEMGEEAVPLIIEGMVHPTAAVRKGSIHALEGMEPAPMEALPLVIAALDDPHEGKSFYTNSADGSYYPYLDVQRAAVDTLRRCYGPLAESAVPKLIELLKMESERENKPAVEDIVLTLEKISGQSFGEDWEAWEDWLGSD